MTTKKNLENTGNDPEKPSDVSDRFEKIVDEVSKEPVPEKLLRAAKKLQAAIDAKMNKKK